MASEAGSANQAGITRYGVSPSLCRLEEHPRDLGGVKSHPFDMTVINLEIVRGVFSSVGNEQTGGKDHPLMLLPVGESQRFTASKEKASQDPSVPHIEDFCTAILDGVGTCIACWRMMIHCMESSAKSRLLLTQIQGSDSDSLIYVKQESLTSPVQNLRTTI